MSRLPLPGSLSTTKSPPWARATARARLKPRPNPEAVRQTDARTDLFVFGEIARNYEDGELVELEGSWTAGKDGAKIGVLMPVAPQPGSIYRQEFLLGEAEDMAEVLVLNGSANTPAASCGGDCLVTPEYTPLEPHGAEHKYYAPGIGMIMERDPETGEPVIELVEYSIPDQSSSPAAAEVVGGCSRFRNRISRNSASCCALTKCRQSPASALTRTDVSQPSALTARADFPLPTAAMTGSLSINAVPRRPSSIR